MPQYMFECQGCRKPFEIAVSMSQYAAMRKDKSFSCPECGSKKVVRVISAPALVRSSSGPGRSCCPGGECV